MASGRASAVPRRLPGLAGLLLFPLLLCAAAAAASPRAGARIPPALNAVLDHLDAAATRLHRLRADVVSTRYTQIVNDTAVERGMIYYRRTKDGPQIALDIETPARREFLYRDQTGYLYQPGIRQVQEYDLRGHHQAVQKYLLLSFGGGGHSLLQSFQVRLGGRPVIAGERTVELVLTPLDVDHAGGIASIDLWFSPRLWVAVRQQVNQTSGDYQRLDYSHIRINLRLGGHIFAAYFPGATVIRPQG
ncbi:MAG: LolA family protein [Terriglobales bacterium]